MAKVFVLSFLLAVPITIALCLNFNVKEFIQPIFLAVWYFSFVGIGWYFAKLK